MRYHYKKSLRDKAYYQYVYSCDHPVYSKCTLFKINDKGLAVIQQRYDPSNKTTWWTEIDDHLVDDIYLSEKFIDYFNKKADHINDKGLYPTVTVRQIMWALRMKPLKKEPWETVFDKSPF